MPASRHRALPVAVLLALCASAPPASQAADRFPAGFLWGTASAGFQSEAGGTPANADRHSDWWAWTDDRALIRDGVVSGDRVERGPGAWKRWRQDIDLARGTLHNNAIRLGTEWSRIFPRSTRAVRVPAGRLSARTLRRLDAVADQRALRHYAAELRYARKRGLRVMLTLNHYTLPLWVHDPLAVRRAFAGRAPDDPVPSGLRRAGWLSARTVADFRTFAAYAAARLGGDVDLWATLNEPLVQASQGYVSIAGVTGVKPPGVLSYRASVPAVINLARGNAAAYDAVRAQRPQARVGVVTNLVDYRPDDPAAAADITAARHASQIFNRLFLDAVVKGRYDVNANGVADPGESFAALRGKADWIGVNHYSPGRAVGLPAPVSPSIPLFDFAPRVVFRGHGAPNGARCPTVCSDFGWEIDPTGMTNVLRLASTYGKPLYVTENGIDDASDAKRAAYLVGYLRAVHAAIEEGIDVRGYFHWSLTDNMEWSEGLTPKFGLFSYDPRTLARRARPSARVYARIARAGAVG